MFLVGGIVLLVIPVGHFGAKNIVASLVVGACAGALIQEVLGVREARRLAQQHNALLGRVASVTDQTVVLQDELGRLRNALIWNRCRTATELGVRTCEALLGDPPEAAAGETCKQLAVSLGLPSDSTDPIAAFAAAGNATPGAGHELYGDLHIAVRNTVGAEAAAALDLGYRLTVMSGIERPIDSHIGNGLADQIRPNLASIGAPPWTLSYFDRVVAKWIAGDLSPSDGRHLFELLILYCENIGVTAPPVHAWEAEMKAFA